MDDKTPSMLQPPTSTSTTFDIHPSIAPLPFALPSAAYLPNLRNKTQLPSISSFLHMHTKQTYDRPPRIFSPPEETALSNFTPIPTGHLPKAYAIMGIKKSAMGQAPLSPPVSPETKNAVPVEATIAVRDPILYPANGDSPSSSPLFPVDHDTHRAVEYHMAAREDSAFRAVSPPRVSDYTLALEFKSHVAKAFNANRRLWAKRELAQLKADSLLKSGGRRYTAIAPASGIRPSIKKIPPRSVGAGSTSGGRVAKTARNSKPHQVSCGETPESGKKVAREDKNFKSLPDYCPPLSSLPSKPNSLKVDWKGAPIDLKADPFAHLLHADEISLAANLRLDCATYLTSKRRIFAKRIEAYDIGKEFRKTDAQQACKIDVNKASKLWQAFDKVGWLNPKWIIDYTSRT